MGAIADEPDIAIGHGVLRPATREFLSATGAETVELQVVRVLMAMAKNQGQVMSRDALVNRGWAGRVVSEDAINRVMSKIRGLATATGAFELDTIRGVGYRLRPKAGAALASDAGVSVEAEKKPATRRVWPWAPVAIAALAILFVCGWLLATSSRHREPGSPPVTTTIAVVPLSNAAGGRAFADRLTAELRTTVSRIHGLRLIDGPVGAGAARTDLVLDGRVDGAVPRPVVTLALHDGRTGARVWGATLDGRAVTDPTVEERAVAAAAQYLAIWLGDRLAGQPAAREQEDPGVAALVAEGRRTLRQADDARLKRQWPKFFQLTNATRAIADRALAIDPKAPGALMLRFELDS
jgi:DNA-binding winged helix-turn-helix (wHTH) protein/TolB-like protein